MNSAIGWLIVGLVLGAAGMAVLTPDAPVQIQFSAIGGFIGDSVIFFTVPVFGAFGGILFSMRLNQLVRPHVKEDNTIDPGWMADLAFGIAGGFVVFLVVPGDFWVPGVEGQNAWHALKAFAVAMVGGFGGRALVQAGADRILADVAGKMESLPDQIEDHVRRMIASVRSVSLDEYLAELGRILEKEKPQGISVIYADVDGLKSHVNQAEAPRVLRAEILDLLSQCLEEAARGGVEHDLFRLNVGDSDRILVLRGAKLVDAIQVGERARTLFKSRTRGRRELLLGPDDHLTSSLGVASSEESRVPRELHENGLARLKAAKKEGKDRVRPQSSVAAKATSGSRSPEANRSAGK